MKKNLIKLALFGCLSLGIISSCTKRSLLNDAESEHELAVASLKLEKGDPNIKLSEAQSLTILESQEAKDLIRFQNEFLDKVKYSLESGKTLLELKDAFILEKNEPKTEAFTKMVFGSKSNWETYLNKLQSARIAFLKQNEILRLNTSSYICTNCHLSENDQISSFFRNFNTYYDGKLQVLESKSAVKSKNGYIKSDQGDEIVCGSYWKQVKLLGCATACSFATAGVGTALCGWACWCRLCNVNSELAEIIC